MRGKSLNKAVLKVKEAKKRMNIDVTIEWNKLVKSKFNAFKDDLIKNFRNSKSITQPITLQKAPKPSNTR